MDVSFLINPDFCALFLEMKEKANRRCTSGCASCPFASEKEQGTDGISCKDKLAFLLMSKKRIYNAHIKPGDKIYYITLDSFYADTNFIVESTYIDSVCVTPDNYIVAMNSRCREFNFFDFGREWFLSKEKADAACALKNKKR